MEELAERQEDQVRRHSVVGEVRRWWLDQGSDSVHGEKTLGAESIGLDRIVIRERGESGETLGLWLGQVDRLWSHSLV